MRTDISEDPKGDPTKIIPQQPLPRPFPDGRDLEEKKEGIEPLLPGPGDRGPTPPAPRPGNETEADREPIADQRKSR